MTQMEPGEENKAVFRTVTPAKGAKELQDSMIEPSKGNAPFYGKAAGAGEASGEMNDSQIEPIKSNNAMFS